MGKDKDAVVADYLAAVARRAAAIAALPPLFDRKQAETHDKVPHGWVRRA